MSPVAGVDVDGEVEEVADRQAGAAVVADPRRLQDVEALDDHDVGALDHDLLVGDDVVDQVGVRRRLDLVLAGLDVHHEPQQRPAVVGLREALAVQQAAALELGVGVEEAVGGDQRDVGCSGQCASICCSTRAVVDLPTATEPASPITNGVRGGCGRCRNSSCARCSRPAPRRTGSAAATAAGRPAAPRRGRARRRGRGPARSPRRSAAARWRPSAAQASRSSSTYGDGLARVRPCPPGMAAILQPAPPCGASARGRAAGRVARPCAESSGTSGRSRPQDVVIEGLRRLEYRGYDSAGHRAGRTTARSPSTSGPASSPTSTRRSPTTRCRRPTTGIGHTRWATHGAPNDRNAHPHLGAHAAGSRWCTTGSSRTSRRCAPSSRPTATRCVSETDTEVAAHLLELAARRGRRPHRRDAARVPPARGGVHAGRGRRAGPDPGGRRPAQLAAGGRHRRGRELRRLRRRGVHRAHPRGARARPGPGRHDHPRRRRGHRLRRRARRGHAATTSTGTSRPPRRAATTGSCARRSTSSRARSPTRCSAGTTPQGLLQLDEMRISEDELREVDKIIIVGCGTAYYAGMVAKYAIEHWTRIPCEVELAHEFRYRDPILDPRHAGRRDQPVRRDRRHPDGDPARARAALQGAGDLQHQRLDDPARVRRGDLHPRRARDRRRLHQGLHDPAGRVLPARALPRAGPGHEVRRRDRPR